MRLGRRGTWVLVVAGVLGIVGGLTAAFVVPQGSESAGDPLDLGIPLANLDCSGDSIMIVGWGSTRAPLAAAVADNPGGDARYLRTDDSCPTLYAPPTREVPDYVVYLGPYDSLGEACGQRLSVEHKGDNLARLNAGNEIYVKCICELPTDGFPELSVGMAATTEDGIWIRGLQGLLNDIDRLADDGITGAYDERTATVIRRIQAHGAVPADGVVDAVTWRILRDRACGTYDY